MISSRSSEVDLAISAANSVGTFGTEHTVLKIVIQTFDERSIGELPYQIGVGCCTWRLGHPACALIR